MKRKTRVLIITTSIIIGLVVMVIATELLSKIIWPSLFVGVPLGIIAAVVSYLVLRKVR